MNGSEKLFGHGLHWNCGRVMIERLSGIKPETHLAIMDRASETGMGKSGQSNEDSRFDWVEESDESQDELLSGMMEQTVHFLNDQSAHARLTRYVQSHRLTSRFSFENLCEMVRCVLPDEDFATIPVEKEEAVNWIAGRLYEDPLALERSENLWNSIITRIEMQR